MVAHRHGHSAFAPRPAPGYARVGRIARRPALVPGNASRALNHAHGERSTVEARSAVSTRDAQLRAPDPAAPTTREWFASLARPALAPPARLATPDPTPWRAIKARAERSQRATHSAGRSDSAALRGRPFSLPAVPTRRSRVTSSFAYPTPRAGDERHLRTGFELRPTPLNVSTFERQTNPSRRTTARASRTGTALNKRRGRQDHQHRATRHLPGDLSPQPAGVRRRLQRRRRRAPGGSRRR